MAEYIPPIENLPTFDTLMFRSANDGITIAEGDTRYLRFPVSQGSETISGNLTITGEGLCSTVPTTNNSLANKLYVDSAVVGGSILGLNNTFTGINTFTNTTIAAQIEGPNNTDIVVEGKGTGDVILKTGTTNRITCADNGAITIAGSSGQPMSITTTGNMTLDSASGTNINIGNGQTSGVINIGVNSSSNRTGAINLGTGAGAGAVNTALNWGTSSNSGNLSFQGGSFTLTSTGNYTQRSGNTFDTTIDGTKSSGNTYIANGNSQTGKIDIGTGTGTKNMNLGGTNTTLNLVGTAINATLMSITNAVSAASASITGLMSAGSISTAGTLSAGASTLTSVITNELDGTAVGTAVSIYDEATRSGAITLGTGATGKTITIGESSASTVNLRGSTIDANKLNVSGTLTAGTFAPTSLTTDTIQGTAVGTAVSVYNEASRTGTVSIATGTGTRFINIGGDSSSTSVYGSTCDVGSGNTTTAVNIANNGFFGGTVNIAAIGSTAKTVNIGTTTNSTINLIGSAITASLMSIAGTLSAGASTLASATITGALGANTATITGALGAGSISTVGTLSAGASTLTSVITDTQTGSAVGTAVSLYDEASRTGTVSIATGTGTRFMNIGGQASSTSIFGSTCDFGSGSTTAAVNIANNGFFAGTVNIAASGVGTKTINIGTTTGTTLNLIGTAINATLMSITNAVSAASASITGLMSAGSISTAGTLSAGASTLASATITGALGANTATITNALGAGSISTAGTLNAGASTLASATITGALGADTATITNALGAGSISTAGTLNAGASTLTSVITNELDGTAVGTAVSIYDEGTRSGAITLGTGATGKIITIGESSASTVNLRGSTIDANKLNVSGTLTAGTFAPTSLTTDTIQGTAVGTAVSLYDEVGRTGEIQIGKNGTSTKTITIGNTTATTVSLLGSTITATKMAIAGALSAAASTLTSVITNTITGTAVGTSVSLYSESSRSGAIEIGNGGSRSGDIRIGNGTSTTGAVLIGRNGGGVSIGTSGSTNTIDGTTNFDNGTHTIFGITNINTTSTLATSIGNTTGALALKGATNTILGTTNINSTGTQSTNIGNATGITTFTGQATFLDNTQLGSTSADAIVPNGTLTKPFIIGTYASQSSFSLSSITPITTYLGGTIQSTNTKTSVATGTFFYAMSSGAAIAPYDTAGGIALTAGTYMFYMGINIEDSSAFNATDIRMGLSGVNTLSSASTEADYRAAVPNLTCYFHKTDSADAVASDSENRVISSCFNIASATTMYPFFICNTSVNIDTYTIDILFTKIGSA